MNDLLRKYQSITKHAGMGVWEFDALTKTFTWDEGLHRLYDGTDQVRKCSMEEWVKFFHEEDQHAVFMFAQKVMSGEIEVNNFLKIKSFTGATKYIRSCAYRVEVDNKFHSLVGISWDVTSESLLQMELVKEKKFTENILNAIPDPIFVKDLEHKWIYANTEFEKLLGIKKTEFIGKSDYDFFDAKMAAVYWEKDQEVFDTNRANENQEQIVLPNGQIREVFTKKTPFYTGNGEKVLVGVIRDITELKNIQNSLIEQSKMASLGEMAAEIAHEVNNPLMIAQGKAQLLIEKLGKQSIDMASCKKDLEAIETNCIRIDKIIKSLKSVSRKADRDPYEEVSILKLIDEAFEISKERFRKRKLNLFVITDEFIDYTYTTQARPSEIVQVLVNLLNNAYDAIESQPHGWARISLTIPNNNFQIEVTDSGNEIEPEVAQRMMEPFFTTKMTGKGTGLGLSVSRQIIQGHNGDLFYDPTSSNTRFVFTLPKL